MKEFMTVKQLIHLLQAVPENYTVVAYTEGQYCPIFEDDGEIDDKREEYVLFDY